MGGNTQQACQIYLEQADRPNLPRYSPTPPRGGWVDHPNTLAGLPVMPDVVCHTLEIDGHTPRQAEEYLCKLGFKFEVDESGDWICRLDLSWHYWSES